MERANEHKRIIVSGAGTGKTSLLRDHALKSQINKNVLYLTYTQANKYEFQEALKNEIGYLPSNVTIMTWFSFLLTHGVRPFPPKKFSHRIDRIVFNNQNPRTKKGIKRGMELYFCPSAGLVYRTRLADLAVYCNEQWHGETINRICSIYDVILIDEAQDFSGYDFDFILSMMNKASEMIVVGDPRQQTYRTAWANRNKNFSTIFDFFEKKTPYTLDTSSLSVTHRCSKDVMDYANRLYSEYPRVAPSDARQADPKGKVTILTKQEFDKFIAGKERLPTVLTWSSKISVNERCRHLNMGESKGLTLDDVAIFTTKTMKQWIEGKQVAFPNSTKSKFYVALTRARGDLFLII